jgi:protein-tyrosine phosphatase
VPFSILYVCTGNVCRSPMAELLLRAWADPRADVEVHSAGLRALVGHEIDQGSASALGQLGIDPSRHRASQFEPWMAADADLILTAERAHRDQIMTELPTVFKRTFTIKEFVRLAPYVTARDPRRVVTEANANRAAVAVAKLEDDDLPDPYRQAASAARPIAAQLTEAVRITLDMLGLSTERMDAARPLPHR